MDINDNNVVQPDQETVRLLSEIRDMTKKKLLLQRISSAAMLGICLILLVAAVNIVPKVTEALRNVNEVATTAINSLHEIDDMVEDMNKASNSINDLVKENAQPLSDAVTNLANVDFEGLNKAIADLQDTVGPMASFFNRFK